MNRATLALLRLLCAFQPEGHDFWRGDDGLRCVKCRARWSL